MDRARLSPKELSNKTVYDRDGTIVGIIREVTYEPGHGVETFDVQVDPDAPHAAEVAPYVELIPDEVERVGVGEVVVSSHVDEILTRTSASARSTTLTSEDATIGVELLDEPAEDEAWGDDDWEPEWADED